MSRHADIEAQPHHSPRGNTVSRIASAFLLFLILFLACIAAVALTGGIHTDGNAMFWDFRLHFLAPKAYFAGLDPYQVNDLNRVNDTGFHNPHFYPYHPLALFLYAPLLQLSFPAAAYVFGFISLAALCGLLALYWLMQCADAAPFRKRALAVLVLLPLMAFAFNNATAQAFRSGNFVLIESFLIWLGLFFLSRRRFEWFLFSIGLVAIVKLTPIVLLPLMFLFYRDEQEKRRLIKMFVVAGGIFSVLWILPQFYAPRFYHEYLRSILCTTNERGWLHPSSLALMKDLCARSLGISSQLMPALLWMAWAGIIASLYLPRVWKYRLSAEPVALLTFSFAAFAVVSPRFKDYAYVQLVPVAWFLCVKQPAWILVFISGLLWWRILPEGFPARYYIVEYLPFWLSVSAFLAIRGYVTEYVQHGIAEKTKPVSDL